MPGRKERTQVRSLREGTLVHLFLLAGSSRCEHIVTAGLAREE